LIKTSFNVRGEPIVCTPEDAVKCFLKTDIDALSIGEYLVERTVQDPTLLKAAREHLHETEKFELD
jgi:carbamoyltransferase